MSPSLRGETLNGREAGASDLFGLRPGARVLDPFEEPIDLSDTILYLVDSSCLQVGCDPAVSRCSGANSALIVHKAEGSRQLAGFLLLQLMDALM
jgi:hypothetical protein